MVTKIEMAQTIAQALNGMEKLPDQDHGEVRRLARAKKMDLEDLFPKACKILKNRKRSFSDFFPAWKELETEKVETIEKLNNIVNTIRNTVFGIKKSGLSELNGLFKHGLELLHKYDAFNAAQLAVNRAERKIKEGGR